MELIYLPPVAGLKKTVPVSNFPLVTHSTERKRGNTDTTEIAVSKVDSCILGATTELGTDDSAYYLRFFSFFLTLITLR